MMTVVVPKNPRSQLLFKITPAITPIQFVVFQGEAEIISGLVDVETGGGVITVEIECGGLQVEEFIIKRHDRRPSLRIRALQDGLPLDLTGASARFLMYSCEGTQKVNAVAAIESPVTAGIVRYDWAALNVDTAGSYRGEFELDFGAGIKLTVPNRDYIPIRVVEDLNNA